MRFGSLGPLMAALLMGCSAVPPSLRQVDASRRPGGDGEPVETRRRADGETVLWYWREDPQPAYGRGNYAARIARTAADFLRAALNDVNIAKLLPASRAPRTCAMHWGRRTASYRLPGKAGEAWNTSSKVPAPLTLFVQLSSDQIVHEVLCWSAAASRRAKSAEAAV